jgi:hypothetical protein
VSILGGDILEHEIKNDPRALSIVYQVDVYVIPPRIIRVVWVVFDTFYFDFASSATNVKTNRPGILS